MTKKWFDKMMALAVVGLASSAVWWTCATPSVQLQSMTTNPPAQTKAMGVSVELTRVVTTQLRDEAQATGSLRARQSVMLRPELAGRVSALGFRDGSPVRQGQVLVQLDDALQQADVAQAAAQVSVAQASFKRNQDLVAANFVAQQALDTSAASLQVARAQLDLARVRLSRMAIRAPFDGVVGMRLVNVGDYVKDGTDLVNLEDSRQMVVDYRLPERFGDRLAVGQTVELTLDALPGRPLQATVDAIDPLQDSNGRSILVRAVLPNTGRTGQANRTPALRSGMFARTTTVFATHEAALMVPEQAIVPQDGRQFVIMAVASVRPGTALVSRRQQVSLGVRRQGMVQISEGLSAGDTVVVAGQQRLQSDGTPLRAVAVGPLDKASAP